MDEEKPHSLGRIASRIVGILVGLSLLYVLSLGPVIFYFETHPSHPAAERFANKCYDPLVIVANKVPLVMPPLKAYLRFWGRLAADQAPQTPPTPP